MNAELARAFLHTLPHVVETVQWGGNLVFWVGDKHLGGKMFALIDLDIPTTAVISYPTTPEHFAELAEQDGLLPAPYFARISWIAAATWSAHPHLVCQDELRSAHALTLNKLPPKIRTTLNLPAAEQKRLIADRKRLLATRAKAAAAPKPANPSSAKSKPAPKSQAALNPLSKAARSASLARAAKAGRPKKHRQS